MPTTYVASKDTTIEDLKGMFLVQREQSYNTPDIIDLSQAREICPEDARRLFPLTTIYPPNYNCALKVANVVEKITPFIHSAVNNVVPVAISFGAAIISCKALCALNSTALEVTLFGGAPENLPLYVTFIPVMQNLLVTAIHESTGRKHKVEVTNASTILSAIQFAGYATLKMASSRIPFLGQVSSYAGSSLTSLIGRVSPSLTIGARGMSGVSVITAGFLGSACTPTAINVATGGLSSLVTTAGSAITGTLRKFFS